MKKAIIIGGASGIGKELSKILFSNGYQVAIADIDKKNLELLADEFSNKVPVYEMNVAMHDTAREILQRMINDLGGADIFVFTAGITDKTRIWENENKLYQVNAIGFAALCSYIYEYWSANNLPGKIVSISSVVAIRGLKQATAYCASKSFMKTYIQALRHDAISRRQDIHFTEIRPGYVRTPMTEKETRIFWSIPVEKAANRIYRALMRNQKTSYLSVRWWIIGIILKLIPDLILHSQLGVSSKVKKSKSPGDKIISSMNWGNTQAF